MNSRCVRCFSARWTLLLLALTFFAATSFGQNVSGFIIAKIQNFQQTSSAAPVANSVAPFQFGSLITMGTATINSATLTFSGTASPRSYTPVGGDFSILDTFTTQAQMDAAYQNGSYMLSINTSAGTFSRSIFLLPFAYPTTPVLTAPASNWQNGALVMDPTIDYTFTWNPFANAQPTDGIELVIAEAGLIFGPLPPTQTSLTLPAGSLQPGIIYTCDLAFLRVVGATAGDSNIGPGVAALAKDTAFALRTQAQPLALASVVSRKIHGGAGSFDVDLPQSGPPGIECRTGGATGDYTLVATFNNVVVSGNATVSSGTGSVSGAPAFSGNTMTINLTGVANAQTVVVTLSNVTDKFFQTLPDTPVTVSILVGDVNGNGAVNATDVALTKSQIGQAIEVTNFRSDVNANGSINATDVSIIKSTIGTGLP